MIWYGSPYLAHAQATRDMSKLTGKQTRIGGFWKTLENGKRIFVNGFNSVRYFARDVANKSGLSSAMKVRSANDRYNQALANQRRLKSARDSAANAGVSTSDLDRQITEANAELRRAMNGLRNAKTEFSRTPLGTVERWVRTAGRNVMSWIRGAGRTISSGLSAAKNWAVGIGKSIFNTVKNWVTKAVGNAKTSAKNAVYGMTDAGQRNAAQRDETVARGRRTQNRVGTYDLTQEKMETRPKTKSTVGARF